MKQITIDREGKGFVISDGVYTLSGPDRATLLRMMDELMQEEEKEESTPESEPVVKKRGKKT